MTRSVNRVLLLGHVGAEPEVRKTPSGVKVANVSLATNRTWNDRSGQQQEKTEWHRLAFWDRLAAIAERYVHKGDRLFVEGRLEYSATQAEDGTTQRWTNIVVSELVLLGGPGGPRSDDPAPGRGTSQAPAPAAPRASAYDDDDLPF